MSETEVEQSCLSESDGRCYFETKMAQSDTLVEHFRFFSENISAKLSSFYTFFFTEKCCEKFKTSLVLSDFISNFFTLREKSPVFLFFISHYF